MFLTNFLIIFLDFCQDLRSSGYFAYDIPLSDNITEHSHQRMALS